jgi:hypothetical protein
MDDVDLVAVVAAEYVRRQGGGAIPHLREQAEMAEGLGDNLSADTWQEITDTAIQILLHSH